MFTAVFVPRDQAQALLPEGYTARDSAAFFGASGVPTGRGVVVASALRCETSALARGPLGEGAVAVYVEAPELDGIEPVSANFYELARAASPATRGRYEPLGWTLFGEDVDVEVPSSPLGIARGAVFDPDGEIVTLLGDAGAYEDSFSEETRWWHATPLGLGWLDASFTLTGFLGPGSCAARAGSVLAEAIGATSCPPGTLTLSGPPFDLTGELRFRPSGR